MIEQVLVFVGEHPYLCGAFFLSVVWLIVSEWRHHGGVPKVSAQMAMSLFNKNKAVLVDVRPLDSYNQGHILGAVNVPVADMDSNLNKLKNCRDKAIIVACNNGIQGVKAVRQLQQKQFKSVSLLEGGVDGWKQQSLPLAKGL